MSQYFYRKSLCLILLAVTGIAAFAATPYAYVSNLSGNNLSVVNLNSGLVTATIPVPSGPNGLAETPDGTALYVVSQSTNSVSILNTATNAIMGSVGVGTTPVKIAISPNGALAYVVNQGSSTISIINVATRTVATTIGVGSHPTGIGFSPDGSRAYVTNLYAGTVSVINTATSSVVSSFAAGSGPTAVGISANGAYAYVANQYAGTVTVHNTANGSIVTTITGFSSPNSVALTPNGNSVFVTNGNSSSVSVISTATNTVFANVLTASLPIAVAISSDGTQAYVINENGFSLSMISTTTFAVTNTIAKVGVYPVAIATLPATGSGPVCTYSISPGSVSVGSMGGPGSVTVTAPTGCAWTAVSNIVWASVTSGATGSGNGTVNYLVNPDTTINGQTGTLTIAGQTFTINEGGITCSYSLSPSSVSLGSAGGAGMVTVTAPAGCLWSAVSNANFLSITSGASGSGTGTVAYLAAVNTGINGQTGTLTIAGQTFTVTEAGITCSYSLSPSGVTLGSSGGAGTVMVTAPSGCAWSAVSNSGFVSITSGASGNGSGTVGYLAAANLGVTGQTGTLTVAGQTFTVNEGGIACSYSLSSNSVSLGSAGGPGTVNVTAPSGCAWSAVSNASFVSITSGASGNGSGTVAYLAAANLGVTGQTGTLTIAGQTFTVNESGIACSYSLSPASVSLGSAGGPGTVSVTAPSGCVWSAASNADFVSITSGTNGNGSGTVGFVATPNLGIAAETGTLTIAGQTFTVNESGIACSYSLSSNSAALTSAGGPGQVTVTAPAGCLWSAVSNSGFLSITAGASGSGAGTVAFLAAANAGLSVQTGTLTIATQNFTVTEAGASFSPVLVNCGGPAYTDAAGNLWTADNSGNISSTTNTIGSTSVPALYQSDKWSTSTLQYQYMVPNGSYNVVLKFAEFYLTQPGQRQFDIVLNGTTVQSAFDILAYTSPNAAYDLTFPIVVVDGQITIQLVPVVGTTKLNALQITPQ